jgi:hypothetical protein
MAKRAIAIVGLFVLAAIFWAADAEAGWAVDGAPVCVWSGEQEFPVICSDGAGGAIIAWEDVRGYRDIYAQRLDHNGRAMWAEGGIPICTASYAQLGPRICSDGAGGAIIAWTDPRNLNVRDIYAQRIDPDGNILWAANGTAVCSETANQHLNGICSDGAGGAILIWQDERVSTAYDDLYCQRIDADGNLLWTASGVPLRVGGYLKEWARVAADGGGGAIFSWIDWEAATIRAQRVNAAGTVMWAVNGLTVRSASGYPYEPEIAPDGAGGAIISWTDNRDWYDIYMQRIDSLGTMLWTANGAAVTTDPGGEDWWQHHARLCGDGEGGAIVTWVDQRVGASDCYAQRVDGAGAPQWIENGVAVCTTQASAQEMDLILVADKGAIITWQDLRSGVGSDIYAQRVDSLGNMEWTINGVALCTAEGSQRFPKVTTDGMDGAITAWEDERIFMDKDIFAHRITDSGGFVATLLQSFRAGFKESAVVIEWALSEIDEGARFVVSRAEAGICDFVALPEENLERDGLDFIYSDKSCLPGESYVYEVAVETGAGTQLLFVTDAITTPAAQLTLHQNHPNPFNPSTTFSFYLPRRCRVTLTIYDAAGVEIRRLVDDELEAGAYSEEWNGTNAAGNLVGSGVYFCRLSAGKETVSRKMILLR